jgi:atypical dual specificity phosphatase
LYRWLYGIIKKKPTNFVWIIEKKLAASGTPTTLSEYRWLRNQGIKVIITIKEKPLSSKWFIGQHEIDNYLHLKLIESVSMVANRNILNYSTYF